MSQTLYYNYYLLRIYYFIIIIIIIIIFGAFKDNGTWVYRYEKRAKDKKCHRRGDDVLQRLRRKGETENRSRSPNRGQVAAAAGAIVSFSVSTSILYIIVR